VGTNTNLKDVKHKLKFLLVLFNAKGLFLYFFQNHLFFASTNVSEGFLKKSFCMKFGKNGDCLYYWLRNCLVK